ncbi:MAG: hypothetical protein ACYDCC_13405 [Actinomycetota bacterium]
MVLTRSDAMLVRASMFASAGAAAIHLGVAHEHLLEWPLAGAFMLGSGLAQLAWIAWIHRSKSRSGIVATGIGNASIIALWIVSRTSGLPIGPTPWKPEDIHSADILCAVLELIVVACAILLLKPSLSRNARAFMISAVAGTIASAVVAMHQPARDRLTAFAALAFTATAAFVAHIRSVSKPVATPGRVHVVEVPRIGFVLDAASGIAIIASRDAA